MRISIRRETPADRAAIHALNVAAFPTPAEATLIDKLRDSTATYLSLVATRDATVVGHIMFSPVELESFTELQLTGLGPMSVAPANQGNGLGSMLVIEGLKRCRDNGSGAVCVLGHPGFYPRFGFLPSTQWQIRSEYDVPEEVFMLTELQQDYLQGFHGVIRYNAAFAAV